MATLPSPGARVVVHSDERLKLVRWRAEALYDAGLRDADVGVMIASNEGIDLHKVCEAKKAGATDRQVALIFL